LPAYRISAPVPRRRTAGVEHLAERSGDTIPVEFVVVGEHDHDIGRGDPNVDRKF